MYVVTKTQPLFVDAALTSVTRWLLVTLLDRISPPGCVLNSSVRGYPTQTLLEALHPSPGLSEGMMARTLFPLFRGESIVPFSPIRRPVVDC